MSDDLVAFLRARVDEDEAAAKAVQDNSEPWRGHWEADGNDALRTYNGWALARAGSSGFRPGVLPHIARNDPARVLSDVEAKRRILARHHGFTFDNGVVCCARCVEGGGIARWPCEDLRDLAAVYSDHPDYQQEWTV